MKSFRMEKVGGHDDVTKETLLWVLVLMVVVLPMIFVFYGYISDSLIVLFGH